jgi:hypothetical protein
MVLVVFESPNCRNMYVSADAHWRGDLLFMTACAQGYSVLILVKSNKVSNIKKTKYNISYGSSILIVLYSARKKNCRSRFKGNKFISEFLYHSIL